MREMTLSLSLVSLLLLAASGAAGKLDLTADVNSGSPVMAAGKLNPSSVVSQFTYDLAVTNVGIEARPDDCLEEGESWEFWVKVQNAGSEMADCAEIVFTLNGVEVGREHIISLYPGEVRKLLFDFVVQWQPCQPFTIDAHVDWLLDENPANDDIEDEFAVTGEPVEPVIRDSGIIADAWTWVTGLEYPDYAQGSKWHFEDGGLIRHWEMAYTHLQGRTGGHAEFFVFEADDNGDIIDDGTGGIMSMEFQFPERYWTDYAFICYPICLPVEPGDTYYFVWCNRQSGVNYWCIDDREDNPDWNWYKDNGVWYSGNLYDGDFVVRLGMEPMMRFVCDPLTPVFCRGKYFYFKLTVSNATGGDISGTLTFRGHSGYDCDPGNTLVALPSYKSYPPGTTEEYYYFNVPGSVQPGQYSASVHGVLSGWEFYCCMNTDIIQCEPWRMGDNTEWQLVQAGRPEVQLPTLTSLHQNYPNPFNERTSISYTLAEAGNVNLKTYDITGRLVEILLEGYQQAGEHTVAWDASEVSSGVYFYKLTTGDYTAIRRMNLLK